MLNNQLEAVIERTERGGGLEKDDIRFLMGLKEEAHLAALFSAARRLRNRYFGNKIFLYGFLYISTYCRNNCRFCYYRNSNLNSVRYRKEKEDIVSAAVELADSAVRMRIEDDGIGFRPPKLTDDLRAEDGLGLIGMHERVRLLGGSLQIESEPGRGTAVLAEVPI